MELLTDELRWQLPLIRKMHNPAAEDRGMIYAKFFTPHSGVVFYVAEGNSGTRITCFGGGLLITPQSICIAIILVMLVWFYLFIRRR